MGGTPFHIVIAEDDDDDQFILADAVRLFNKSQVMITPIVNGAELIAFLDKAATGRGGALPDVIVLDINMPVMDGLESLKRIKKDERLRHIPVYIVTTLRNMDKLEYCLEAGAANFFTKPSHIRGYVRIIDEIMGSVLEDK